MSVNDIIGDRLKEFYENTSKTRLIRRTPVALRIDGCHFHTFTRGFQKPFDEVLMKTMQDTMEYLCENIQGCVFGYTQSDEITLILVDYKKLTSCAWFDNQVQKICSVSASMATMAFNKFFEKNVAWFKIQNKLTGIDDADTDEWNAYIKYIQAIDDGATFDSRCFNIPKEEVANLIYWRQKDASKNSVQMLARNYFSDKELHGLSCSQMQDLLMNNYNVNWNNLETYKKRGSACVKINEAEIINGQTITRSKWTIDLDMPIIAGENRKYVEKFVYVSENEEE